MFSKTPLAAGLLLSAFTLSSFAETLHGVIQKLDTTAKTVVVKTGEGTEKTLHYTEKTVVHGAAATERGSWKGLKEGTEVVARSTAKGTEETAIEMGRVGHGGFKVVEGTVVRVDHAGKVIVVKGADGTEHTIHATGHAFAAFGKETAKGTEKTAKVTVYYTETAGKKIGHFIHG